MPTLRTLLFWPHLVAGATAGLLILTMSATGVLLTYERQLISWSDRQTRSTPTGEPRLAPGTVIDRLRAADPSLVPSALTMAADPNAPVTVVVGQTTLLVDGYSGRLLGEASRGVRQTMSRIRAWHRWLAVDGEGRETARRFTGWATAVFLFIVCSGVYLWIPRRWTWRNVRGSAVFKRDVTGKARDFNWHHVVGVWSLVPLAIVAASALPMSFQWVNASLYRIAGDATPAPRGERAPQRAPGAPPTLPSSDVLDALWDKASAQEPDWTTITVRMPVSADAPLAFAIDRGTGGQPQLKSTLTLTAAGQMVSYDTFADQKRGARLRSLSRFAHTGEVLGIAGQTVAGLASAGACVLVWTGLALTLRRCRSWLGRRFEDRSRAPVNATAA